MNEAFASTPAGHCCTTSMVSEMVENYIGENDKRIREILQFVSEQQKAVLYAIKADEPVNGITSSAFTKRHRLKSPSATQSAVKALLRSDLITRTNGSYSISDPLMSLWMERNI